MRKVSIIAIASLFGMVHAGSLPSDFHFKPASNQRISIIQQLKEYEEKAENEGRPGLEDTFQQSPELFKQVEEDKEIQQYGLIERCKRLILYLLACCSIKKD